jgi:hypothetical protein
MAPRAMYSVWTIFRFDTTLDDRFIFEATKKIAIGLSNETWVEWVAPAEAGTIYDSKAVQWWEVEKYRNAAIGAGVGGIGGALAGYLITKKPLYALVGIPGIIIGGVVGYLIGQP